MRRLALRTWMATAAGACTVVAVTLVVVHRGSGEVVYTTDLHGPPAPVVLSAGTNYHVAIASSHCGLGVFLEPAGGSDNDPRSLWFLNDSATSSVVQDVDQDFQVIASGSYRLMTEANLGTRPDPSHPCRITATITRA